MKTLSPPLTKKQRAVLDFLKGFAQAHGYTPSYREMAKHLNLSSPATIFQHVQALKTKGALKDEEQNTRSLEIVESDLFTSINLPLVGIITAGEPIEAVEQRDSIAVPSDLVVDNQNSYVLKVRGDSMIEDGILDGDFVIVERNPSPKNGDVVVALLDNAYATLKRFYKEHNRIRLQPANARMRPIFCKDIIIQGVVRAVIRKYQFA